MPRYVDPGHIPGAVFIPNCAAVRLIWHLPNGKEASNVLHGSYTTAPARTQAFVNTLYTAISTAFTASALSNAVHDTARLEAVGVRDMAQTTPVGGWAELRSNLAPTAGTAAGDPMPANVSFVVSLKTDRRGQANRGRVYLTAFDENANDPFGNASDDVRNACVDFIGRVQTAMGTSGLTLAIAHPARAAYTSPTPPNTEHPARTAGTVQVISITALNNVWDSTRLRSLR